jgi:YbbR domain-containing protein
VKDLTPGKYGLPVQLEFPNGLRLAGYSPQSVDIELFRIIERTFKPSLSAVGVTPENLSLGAAEITPAEVVARGPEASVLSIRRAEVRSPVENLIRGINEDLPVALVGDDGDVSGVSLDPGRVRVSAKLAELMEQKRVPIRTFVEGTPHEGLDVGSVSVSPDMVTLRGRKSDLQSVNEIVLNAIVVTGQSETMNIDLPLESPAPDISVLSADRVNVRVEFNSAVEVVTFYGVPISIEGVGGYNEWNLGPSAVSVTVERTVAATEPFDMDNPPLSLYVDVTNVVSMRMILPVLVKNSAEGISVLSVEPEQVNIVAVPR